MISFAFVSGTPRDPVLLVPCLRVDCVRRGWESIELALP
jgi:hypothetical protein